MTAKQLLIELGACKPAIRWVGNRSMYRAWMDCQRADWMIWLAVKVDVKSSLLRGALEAVYHHVYLSGHQLLSECPPRVQAKLARIVRKHIPWRVIKQAIERRVICKA